jgi:hypothetical protein
MPKDKDPTQVIESLRQEIKVSQRGERRLKLHNFKDLFGYQVLTAERRESIEDLLEKSGIVVRPLLAEARGDDWIRMSIPEPSVRQGTHPDPPLSVEDLNDLITVTPDTEVEVYMHFVSPLFTRALGYKSEQEAAGFPITSSHGGKPQHIQADLIYFADKVHDLETGLPLVLVECKRPGASLKNAIPQARDYSLWVRPAYYVVTDCLTFSVWDYQGAIGPDLPVLEFRQEELPNQLDKLYSYLNPAAAIKTLQRKRDRLRPAR